MTEPLTSPPGVDLFEAAARLRLAAVFGGVVKVHAADLTAVLDAPGGHALTDGSVRRAALAFRAASRTRSPALAPLDAAFGDPAPVGEPTPLELRWIRAAIAAALRLEETR
jgi:hypothetical protein